MTPGDPAAAGLRTAAVVVTHQTRDQALACVDTLRAAGAAEIVVVDTGSRDGTVAAVRAHDPDVEVLALSNVGYARAANAGVARTSAPHVVVANADTRFAPTSLTALAVALEDDAGVGAAGPLVRYPDGRRQASARLFPTLGQAAGHALLGLIWPDNPWTRAYTMRGEGIDRPRDVDWVSGCAVAIRRDAFDRVGGFDPGYFMFVEDVDLCYRLREAGWRIRYVPASEVVHEVGASTRQRRVSMVLAHARSLDRFYGRAYARGSGRLLRPLVRAGLAVWALLVIARGAIDGLRRGPAHDGSRRPPSRDAGPAPGGR